jgi:hypothetical protein
LYFQLQRNFLDVQIEAYVSGWGTLADQKCTTDDKGPAKHRKCAFPFNWMNQTHRACTFGNTPSYYDEDCKRLADILQETTGGAAKEETEIVDSQGKLIKKCFTHNPGKAGW